MEFVIFSMKKYCKYALFMIALIVMASFSSSGQRLSDRYFGISKQDFVDTIKIKMWKGAIIVPVEIEGKIRNLMFDSGAGMGFWIGEKEEWMVPSGDSIHANDAQDRAKNTPIMKIPSMKMGGLTIKDYPIIVDDGMSDFTCGIIDGALGFDFAAKGISFKFDTKDSLLIMTSRKGFCFNITNNYRT